MSHISHNNTDDEILAYLNLEDRTDGELLDLIYRILQGSEQSKATANIFLTGGELEALTGLLGEMLDDNKLDNKVRQVMESILRKATVQLGLW